ncbi:hypothetical protein DW322_11315 [Rhodococcus rhodnii]|uniref:Gp28/Gp37-like domain-containing protein n=1 Tax=Rhodococcus rhodnii TaxID=38312 RepID=A0A6P2CNA8_9NOCA|nr:hypothetical protein DW322_11315 [Rhodococcus rhodnii]
MDFDLTLEEQCEAIWEATRQAWQREQNLRQVPPLMRLWDGDMRLQHVVACEYGVDATLVDGDTGPIQVDLPFDHPVGQWMWDTWGRIERGEKQNVIVTIDYTGARIDGLLADVTLAPNDQGAQVLTCTFTSSYELLKSYHVWSNPVLPAAAQLPRTFILAGPVPWVLGTTLHLQLLRENLSLWAIPDDPLDPSTWFNLDQSQWSIVVKPLSFMQSMASGALWGIASSRWKNWHDMAAPMMRDAEITPVLRRHLAGDPPPWPGANLKHGALVVSFEDKSGSYTGTSNGGTIFDGLARTFAELTEDLLDSTAAIVTDQSIPAEYYQPGNRLTRKELPFAVWLCDEQGRGPNFRVKQTMGRYVQLLTGGHSAPGVNELISAGIQALGDILGNLAQIGSIGGSVDTVLRPFYEDTLLAWIAVKILSRAQTHGWVRLFEYFQQSSGRAYTLNSIMVLRQAAWATRRFETFEMDVTDGAPFLIGDQGQGHVFLGDRGGLGRIPGDPTGRIFIRRMSKLNLSWDRQKPWGWTPTFGDERGLQDPVEQLTGMLEVAFGAVHDLGVL